MNTVGDYLRECRDREGLSQRGVAHRVGMSPQYYGMMERGTKPLPDCWIDRIAEVITCVDPERVRELNGGD